MLPSPFRPQGIRTAIQTKTDRAYKISFKMTHITEKNKKISIFNSVKKAIKKIKNYCLLQR